ncbi:uncharacterized protein BDW47DRAFT_112702 [Aspergillus candidus]|uniref:Uncharacterized protein n=1 Tax=Aspergillus candidus TaxID=41067 RepID=A0A2I2F0Q8_ASPCN|nr:hypothetical protein BDW47DRAFT_112702 [Aspergillus candidus]PLB34209.1 hypothetical protein BDW47DRAFT_112702 [Aspergillus candidus]
MHDSRLFFRFFSPFSLSPFHYFTSTLHMSCLSAFLCAPAMCLLSVCISSIAFARLLLICVFVQHFRGFSEYICIFICPLKFWHFFLLVLSLGAVSNGK